MPDSPKSNRGFVSVAEFADFSGLSVKTVWRRLKDGSLPKFQPGGPGTRVTIPVAALSALPPESQPTNTVAQRTVQAISAQSKKSTRSRPRWMSRTSKHVTER